MMTVEVHRLLSSCFSCKVLLQAHVESKLSIIKTEEKAA